MVRMQQAQPCKAAITGMSARLSCCCCRLASLQCMPHQAVYLRRSLSAGAAALGRGRCRSCCPLRRRPHRLPSCATGLWHAHVAHPAHMSGDAARPQLSDHRCEAWGGGGAGEGDLRSATLAAVLRPRLQLPPPPRSWQAAAAAALPALTTATAAAPIALAQEERDTSLDAFRDKFGAAGEVRRDDLTIMASKTVGAAGGAWGGGVLPMVVGAVGRASGPQSSSGPH